MFVIISQQICTLIDRVWTFDVKRKTNLENGELNEVVDGTVKLLLYCGHLREDDEEKQYYVLIPEDRTVGVSQGRDKIYKVGMGSLMPSRDGKKAGAGRTRNTAGKYLKLLGIANKRSWTQGVATSGSTHPWPTVVTRGLRSWTTHRDHRRSRYAATMESDPKPIATVVGLATRTERHLRGTALVITYRTISSLTRRGFNKALHDGRNRN